MKGREEERRLDSIHSGNEVSMNQNIRMRDRVREISPLNQCHRKLEKLGRCQTMTLIFSL
jgi:hypothetical protein